MTSLDRKFHPHLPVVMVKKPSYARRAKKVGSCQLTQGPRWIWWKNSKVPDPNLFVCPIKPGSLTSIGKVWHVPGILFACAFYGKCWLMHIFRQSCCLPLAVWTNCWKGSNMIEWLNLSTSLKQYKHPPDINGAMANQNPKLAKQHEVVEWRQPHRRSIPKFTNYLQVVDMSPMSWNLQFTAVNRFWTHKDCQKKHRRIGAWLKSRPHFEEVEAMLQRMWCKRSQHPNHQGCSLEGAPPFLPKP